MKKSVIAIVMTALFIVSMIAPLLTVQADATSNTTVSGVLKSDSYVLYPYNKENLYLGISKYGELINGDAKQGLKYGTMDVFANPNVPEADWSQGWYIDIHFADNDNNFQNIWAFAMYTDLSGTGGIGGDWKEACVNGPLGTPHGGRKTNAWATTAPITVLYDGPRRAIIATNTTLYVASTKTADDALVGIELTFVFDKVKKCVVVFKDIKRLNPGKWTRTFQVEFSNRGEWDIGDTSAPPSYANFYDNQPTAYNNANNNTWHDFYCDSTGRQITGFDVAQMINKAGTYVGFAAFWPQLFGKLVDGTTHLTRTEVLTSLCTKMFNRTWEALGSPSDKNVTFALQSWPSADSYPRGAGEWSDEPMVFLNGILQSGSGVDYTWYGDDVDKIVFTVEPSDTDYITVVYKHQVPTGGGPDNMFNHVAEPQVPYVIGEWCFDLKSADKCRQFRAVTVYGLTDRHDADDANTLAEDRALPLGWSLGADKIDSEVKYYLNETFNPWDLYNAVEKDERRWVYFYTVTSDDYLASLFGVDLVIPLPQKPVHYESSWEQYSGFSEKVMWSGALKTPTRATALGYDYELSVSPTTGVGIVDIPAVYWIVPGVSYISKVPVAGTVIKILYSTDTDWGWEIPTVEVKDWEFTNQPLNDTGVPLTLIDAADFNAVATDVFGAKMGTAVSDFSVTLLNGTMDAEEQTFTDYIPNYFANFKVFKGETAWFDGLQYPYEEGVSNDLDINVSMSNIIYNVTAPATQDIHVDYLWPYLHIDVEAVTNGTHYNATVSVWVDGLAYSDHIGGRYEWAEVGRDAASVDSAGASLVTAAFKNKQVEIGVAGEDMFDPEIANQMPWVMCKFGTTDTWADYYYSATDFRTALRDDWCRAGTVVGDEVPVASSDMIGVGGPLANLLAYYGNDFTDAIYGLPQFSGTAYSGKITGVSCWNRGWEGAMNTYSSSNTIGYAVISTYQDINGTNLFLIWGNWGRDTYYVTKWFHEYEIYELQSARAGITSMIVKITYESTSEGYKPKTFSIVESLGTISETLWKYGLVSKGGIHDP